jgi:hypothetical protein
MCTWTTEFLCVRGSVSERKVWSYPLRMLFPKIGSGRPFIIAAENSPIPLWQTRTAKPAQKRQRALVGQRAKQVTLPGQRH